MSGNLLFVDDKECDGKINIDDLYEKNRQRDLKQLSIFNKILNRIHRRILTSAKNKRHETFAWFQVPPYLFGEPNYDQGDCVAYLVKQLVDNGFHVRYIHPNTLFISWENWVPSYVRTEIKKKTGKIINEKGQVIGDVAAQKEGSTDDSDPNKGILNDRSQPGGGSDAKAKQYTPIDQYKPEGKLVYNPEMFYKLGARIRPPPSTQGQEIQGDIRP